MMTFTPRTQIEARFSFAINGHPFTISGLTVAEALDLISTLRRMQ